MKTYLIQDSKPKIHAFYSTPTFLSRNPPGSTITTAVRLSALLLATASLITFSQSLAALSCTFSPSPFSEFLLAILIINSLDTRSKIPSLPRKMKSYERSTGRVYISGVLRITPGRPPRSTILLETSPNVRDTFKRLGII